MEKVKTALEDYAANGPGDSGHVLRGAANVWALWCISNTTGKRLRRGLEIVAALANYAALDDNTGEVRDGEDK